MMSKNIDDLISLGFILHPLNKKIPMINGWQNMTESYPYIEEHMDSGGNVGLVCGKTSNVTVIDMDSFLFADDIFGKGVETLKSYRTEGRGHIYFKYNPDLPSSKHHYLGIEILSDGGNIVLPPSLHYRKDGTLSGDRYAWKDISTPIATMAPEITKRLLDTFKIESELKQHLSKCRTCIRDILQRNHEGKLLSMHGAVGREYMLAICTDLKNAGAQQEHILMFSKLIYKDTFDASRTLKEWYAINASMTWTCDKMRAKFPEYLDSEQCAQCDSRKAIYTKKYICMSDARGGSNCSICPYHPSNSPTNINKGEENMFEYKPQPPTSMAQIRKDFSYRLSNFTATTGQFTIVEDLPVTRPVRTVTKQSSKGGKYDVYVIKITADGFEGDLEMFKTELMKLAIVMPPELTNFKGVTMVYDGKWTAYSPNSTPNETTKIPNPTNSERPNQIDEMSRRLQGMVQLNDVQGKGLSAKDVLIYAQLVSPPDALGLIAYTKTKGLIAEQDGIYKAV